MSVAGVGVNSFWGWLLCPDEPESAEAGVVCSGGRLTWLADAVSKGGSTVDGIACEQAIMIIIRASGAIFMISFIAICYGQDQFR